MNRETAPSEETRKEELNAHNEIQASGRNPAGDSTDENQPPHEEVPEGASDEEPEALKGNELKAEANDEEKSDMPEETTPSESIEDKSDEVGPEQGQIDPPDEPDKAAEKVLEEANMGLVSGEQSHEEETGEKLSEPVAEKPDIEETTTEEDGDVTADPETADLNTDTEEKLSEPVAEKPDSERTTTEEAGDTTNAADSAGSGEVAEEKSSGSAIKEEEPKNEETALESGKEKPAGEIVSETTGPAEISSEVPDAVVSDSEEKELVSEEGKEEVHQEVDIEKEEEDIHDDGDELVHADYTQYSKEELVATVKKLTKIDDFKKVDLVLNVIDPLFQKMKEADRSAALEKYIAEGGSTEDFAYKNDPDQRYDAYYKLIKERKHKFYGDLGRQKLENYQKATELLEKLRHLVDGEESTTSINAIKEIQEEWKSIGQVPAQHVRNLWASYNALMDRFYDNRSIYFELKELDRKKNLEAKEELCVRAENLEKVENLKDAIKELNELHNEYKHIGPVPRAQQEALWQRFKAASDKVYARRKSYYDGLKKDLEKNLEAKAELREEVQPFADFDSDRIVEWNKKTQEILDIQKRWEAIGGLPRDRAQEVNKPFWSAFKRFFNNKNNFFKKLEGQREDNLKLKEELVAKADELKDSTDWNQTAAELKKLQNDWRNIGPVPEKHRNEIYKRFKAACDFFFEKRRNRFKEVEKEYEQNLKLKEDVCHRILELAEEGAGDIGQLEALQEEWNNIGFVPRNAIRSSQEMFARAVDKFIAQSSLDEDEKAKLKITTKLTSLKGTPNANRKLNKKEFTLRRQISNLENDITLWKNNLEFFANSKNADQVREEFDQKIEKAKKQLKELKAQLKIIRDI